jgi:hypothetical protein
MPPSSGYKITPQWKDRDVGTNTRQRKSSVTGHKAVTEVIAVVI